MELIEKLQKIIEREIDNVPMVLTDPLTLRRLRAERLAQAALTAINAELVEALNMARDLIQEAKGADGPNGGFITDHLDAAQNWIDNALVALARAKENSNGH